ncbi:hypothetical protein [Micromonospora ureilytica]|uniref:hypothetical protein n=1 Tax=Micromonospora ureilytica TaxID=709868 RepID=UPI002E1221AE|nr:hypothetical protein OHB55_22040 [Micromonospora ureilytica]
MAYQDVIDWAEVADARLVMAWARATGWVSPKERHMSVLTPELLGDFAEAHGLPREYFTLVKDGEKPRVVPESNRYPGGANPQSAALRRIPLPSGWLRGYLPAAYQEVIDNPAIADPSLVLAWARATGRVTSSVYNLREVPKLLGDFTDAHGLPRDYYTVVQAGKPFLESRSDRYPGGANPHSAASQRISLPASWARLYTPAAYQEVVDNPRIADVRLVVEWARATGRLARSTRGDAKATPAVIGDFAAAHGLRTDSYPLAHDGTNYYLKPDLDRLAVDPNLVVPYRINLPEQWKQRRADAAPQYGQPVDPPANQLAAPAGQVSAYAEPSGQYTGYSQQQADPPQNTFASSAGGHRAAPGPADMTMMSSSTGGHYPYASQYQDRQVEYPPQNPYPTMNSATTMDRGYADHTSGQYVSGSGASTSYGFDQPSATRYPGYSGSSGYGSSATGPSMLDDNNYSWQPAAPEFQHTDSSNNLADISYTTQQMNSLNITTDNWQPSKVAGVPSSVATPAPQTELNPNTDREPTPEPRPGKRRHRR